MKPPRLNRRSWLGYGANPNEVVEVARKLDGIVIRGNHDRACSGIMHFSEFRDLSFLAAYAAQWTQTVLSNENTQWLSQLGEDLSGQFDGKVQCVHGAPRNDDHRSGRRVRGAQNAGWVDPGTVISRISCRPGMM